MCTIVLIFSYNIEVIICTCSTVKIQEDLSVQCDTCSQWYHATCADFDEDICSEFVCIACLIKKVS